MKKTSRVENEIVSVVEWRGDDGSRRWLFVKRPEKGTSFCSCLRQTCLTAASGLLAGLFEPVTVPVSDPSTPSARLEKATEALSLALASTDAEFAKLVASRRDIGSIPHIFSHINMTYHILHLTLSSSSPPSPKSGIWLDEAAVESANVGTGVKKVWAEVYGSWGSFIPCVKQIKVEKRNKKQAGPEGKISKKIRMPVMPSRVQ